MTNEAPLKPLIAERFRGFLPVVVDVETGGFNATTDALLEIAAVTLTIDATGQMVPEDTIDFAIKPFADANIEPAAIEFTGIDPFCPERQASDEDEALKQLFKRIRKAIKSGGCNRAILVGHNAMFDLNFLNAAVIRNNLKRNPFHPFSSFDTATLAGLAFGQTVLAKACEAADISFDSQEAHSAAYDANKTAELFCSIVNRWQALGGWPVNALK